MSEGEAALVTGGAQRIGAALARALAARGVAVAVHYYASRAAAEALVEELHRRRGAGGGDRGRPARPRGHRRAGAGGGGGAGAAA